MRTLKMFMLCTVILFIISNNKGTCQSPLESGKLIPVYPGADLITEPGESEELSCCNFKTTDSFEKVVGFYETSLKLKALDVNALALQHPYLKAQTDMMLKEMPAGMKIKFFVLKVVEFQGQKGAELFEVSSSARGTEFSIMDSQLLPGDRHFLTDMENFVSGKPAQADPGLLIAALPSSTPSGYTKEELQTNQIQGRTDISIGYTKVIREPKLGEFGDDLGLISTIGIGIEEAEKEFYEEMIKPYEDTKSIMVKGKYRGVERITKEENGLYNAGTTFGVNNRFLVTVSGVNVSDPKIITQIINDMNLDALPK